MVILENIDIDIDKAILQNIDIDKISNRFKFGISNRATSCTLTASFAILANAASVTVVRMQVLLVLLALLALLVACIASTSRVNCRHY